MKFIIQENPKGPFISEVGFEPDTFVFKHEPVPHTLQVFLNGLCVCETFDYTKNKNSIRLRSVQKNCRIRVNYYRYNIFEKFCKNFKEIFWDS